MMRKESKEFLSWGKRSKEQKFETVFARNKSRPWVGPRVDLPGSSGALVRVGPWASRTIMSSLQDWIQKSRKQCWIYYWRAMRSERDLSVWQEWLELWNKYVLWSGGRKKRNERDDGRVYLGRRGRRKEGQQTMGGGCLCPGVQVMGAGIEIR